ncbi:2586_t:CDS:2, partial [Gigaspora margarita]
QFYQITTLEFQNINKQSTNMTRSQLCSQYGLQLLPGPLDSILYNRYQHTSQDIYHAIAGKFIDVNNFSIHTSQDYDQDNFPDNNSFSHFNCSEIKLRTRWNKYEIESARFIFADFRTNRFLENIMRAYSSYFSLEQALLNTKISYHQNVSYFITESNSDYQHVKFGIVKIVETTLPNKQQSEFGVIKGIIKHIWNNNQTYVFIYLN